MEINCCFRNRFLLSSCRELHRYKKQPQNFVNSPSFPIDFRKSFFFSRASFLWVVKKARGGVRFCFLHLKDIHKKRKATQTGNPQGVLSPWWTLAYSKMMGVRKREKKSPRVCLCVCWPWIAERGCARALIDGWVDEQLHPPGSVVCSVSLSALLLLQTLCNRNDSSFVTSVSICYDKILFLNILE